ncbi:MAG: aminoglycoside phosphotransferase family protein, partial [Gammaproteobacteria bacterium]
MDYITTAVKRNRIPMRHDDLKLWVTQILKTGEFQLSAASSDASFRHYWRIRHRDRSYIVMDAPPERETCDAFIDIAKRLGEAGLNAPKVLAGDLARGFLLLTDLGTRLYLDELQSDNAGQLYSNALNAVVAMQVRADGRGLPPYDRDALMREMELFRGWLLAKELGLRLSAGQNASLDASFAFLAESALSQPRVFVHRDFHSRNLLVSVGNDPGILDFQDAVIGPVTYDVVSLLRDCYIRWPREEIEAWAAEYYRRALEHGILSGVSLTAFYRWFDLMGVQRHLKASGIFARLWHRDAK